MENKLNLYGRYILFVGRRAGYKNFKTFAKGVSVLLNKESELKLICVGHPFDKQEIADLKALNIYNQTIALSVNEDLLNNLYAHALVFVYPSLYEGFGMPILEAFANKCPVCLSNISSLPEVAGDAAVYFDPKYEESILDAIERIIYDTELSKKFIESGMERLKNFSWVNTAEQTIQSYRAAL